MRAAQWGQKLSKKAILQVIRPVRIIGNAILQTMKCSALFNPGSFMNLYYLVFRHLRILKHCQIHGRLRF